MWRRHADYSKERGLESKEVSHPECNRKVWPPLRPHPELGVAPLVAVSKNAFACRLVLSRVKYADNDTLDAACPDDGLNLGETSIHSFMSRCDEKDW